MKTPLETGTAIMPPIPSVLAILLCDTVLIDALTGKKSLVGVFEALTFPQLPVSFGGFFLFARITDAEGNYNFRVNLVRLDSDTTLATIPMISQTIQERLSVGDLILQVPPLQFDKLGGYEFQLFANDIYIGRTTVTVRQSAPGGQGAT